MHLRAELAGAFADKCVHPRVYIVSHTRAIDRVHRLGQRRDVQVFRFTVKDTVEQQMLVIQARGPVRFGYWMLLRSNLVHLGGPNAVILGLVEFAYRSIYHRHHLISSPPKKNNTQEKKAAIAKNALACVGGKKEEGRLNLEDLRRFFV